MLKRNKRSVMPNNGNGSCRSKEERLLLTNGTPCRFDSFSNPKVFDYGLKEEKGCDDDDDTYSGKDVAEVKWDSMFQNLKPT